MNQQAYTPALFGDSQKVQLFFQLLRASYGADVIDRKWPTDKDKLLVGTLKREAIERLTIAEIRSAIDNAAAQKAKGIEEFMFLDVDLIISGAKRYANGSHRLLLPEPPETEEQKAARKERGKAHINNLKSILGGAT